MVNKSILGGLAALLLSGTAIAQEEDPLHVHTLRINSEDVEIPVEDNSIVISNQYMLNNNLPSMSDYILIADKDVKNVQAEYKLRTNDDFKPLDSSQGSLTKVKNTVIFNPEVDGIVRYTIDFGTDKDILYVRTGKEPENKATGVEDIASSEKKVEVENSSQGPSTTGLEVNMDLWGDSEKTEDSKKEELVVEKNALEIYQGSTKTNNLVKFNGPKTAVLDVIPGEEYIFCPSKGGKFGNIKYLNNDSTWSEILMTEGAECFPVTASECTPNIYSVIAETTDSSGVRVRVDTNFNYLEDLLECPEVSLADNTETKREELVKKAQEQAQEETFVVKNVDGTSQEFEYATQSVFATLGPEFELTYEPPKPNLGVDTEFEIDLNNNELSVPLVKGDVKNDENSNNTELVTSPVKNEKNVRSAWQSFFDQSFVSIFGGYGNLVRTNSNDYSADFEGFVGGIESGVGGKTNDEVFAGGIRAKFSGNTLKGSDDFENYVDENGYNLEVGARVKLESQKEGSLNNASFIAGFDYSFGESIVGIINSAGEFNYGFDSKGLNFNLVMGAPKLINKNNKAAGLSLGGFVDVKDVSYEQLEDKLVERAVWIEGDLITTNGSLRTGVEFNYDDQFALDENKFSAFGYAEGNIKLPFENESYLTLGGKVGGSNYGFEPMGYVGGSWGDYSLTIQGGFISDKARMVNVDDGKVVLEFTWQPDSQTLLKDDRLHNKD